VRYAERLSHTSTAWAAEWHSHNKLDGDQRWLMCKPVPPYVMLWKTRRECAAWIHETHGYIASRHDLRVEPHGWRMPRPVKVDVRIAKAGGKLEVA
jgi:hypothetical protein